jgi:hypothetical protein
VESIMVDSIKVLDIITKNINKLFTNALGEISRNQRNINRVIQAAQQEMNALFDKYAEELKMIGGDPSNDE